MTRRATIVRLGLATALLVVAVGLVLLALDAGRWGDAVRDGDEQAVVGQVDPAGWDAGSILPGDPARRLLGVEDDLAFRRTVARAIEAAALGASTRTRKPRSQAETALARVVHGDSSHARASRAADYLGVLLYSDPATPQRAVSPYQNPNELPSSAAAETPEQKALAEFETAVLLDPANANAKRNLEAMLQQRQPPGRQGTPRAGSGERIGSKGSGSRAAGRGY
jgi:hypothetical protein